MELWAITAILVKYIHFGYVPGQEVQYAVICGSPTYDIHSETCTLLTILRMRAVACPLKQASQSPPATVLELLCICDDVSLSLCSCILR